MSKLIKPTDLFRIECIKQGTTLKELGTKLGVNPNSIYQLNKHVPRLNNLGLKVGQALGLSPQLMRDYCWKYQSQKREEA